MIVLLKYNQMKKCLQSTNELKTILIQSKQINDQDTMTQLYEHINEIGERLEKIIIKYINNRRI